MHQFRIPKILQPAPCTIVLPGSKSIALRQMAISALVEGTSTLSGIPVCDDIEAMLDCLKALGVGLEIQRHGEAFELIIEGTINFDSAVELNARMSGASTRLLLGLAGLRAGSTVIDGHASLRVRTNQPLLDTLQAHGCSVDADAGGLPAKVQGPLTASDQIEVDGSISSQYITALMLISPTLLERSGALKQTIRIAGELVSKPYLDITISEMAKRHALAEWSSPTELVIANHRYTPGHIEVEGDATAASYFLALATLHNVEVSLPNLGGHTCQGDFAFAKVMERLGARLDIQPERMRIAGPQKIAPLAEINMQAMPDAALTLIAMAPLIPGATKITGLSTLHHKECDRLECSAEALLAMGVAISTTEDSITVPYCPPNEIRPHMLNTYHDHRMAMAFSTLGSVTGNLTVDEKTVVEKTYPHYWQDYQRLAG